MSTVHEQIIKIGSLIEIAGGGQIRNCGSAHAQCDILTVYWQRNEKEILGYLQL